MTDTATIRRALDMVEQATGPDRKIDYVIARLAGMTIPDDPAGWPPNFAGDLNVVVSLIEREMPDYLVADLGQNESGWWGASFYRKGITLPGEVPEHGIGRGRKCPTPALALLAAFLRAKLAEQREIEGVAKRRDAIIAQWDISPRQMHRITRDDDDRLRIVLAIAADLDALFQDDEEIRTWLIEPQEGLYGRMPLPFMMESLAGPAVIRDYVAYLSGR